MPSVTRQIPPTLPINAASVQRISIQNSHQKKPIATTVTPENDTAAPQAGQ